MEAPRSIASGSLDELASGSALETCALLEALEREGMRTNEPGYEEWFPYIFRGMLDRLNRLASVQLRIISEGPTADLEELKQLLSASYVPPRDPKGTKRYPAAPQASLEGAGHANG